MTATIERAKLATRLGGAAPPEKVEGIYRLTIQRGALRPAVYIGRSDDIRQRREEHLWALRAGVHHNDRLQRAFDEYGEGSLSFEYIDYGLRLLYVVDDRGLTLLPRVSVLTPEEMAALETQHIRSQKADKSVWTVNYADGSSGGASAPRMAAGWSRPTSSRFKGVYLDKAAPAGRPWKGQITVARRTYHLGYWATEVEAALAYDLAVERLLNGAGYKNFARIEEEELL